MDFKVNREILDWSEVVFDGLQEQSVELDYILPDYFPDIFKMIKCQLLPRIISSNVAMDKITYELIIGIKILYCSEGSSAVHCIEQKLNYTKSLDLTKSCTNPTVTLTPKVDYVNCRVVNQRRLDLRGAISTKIKIICQQSQEVVSDAYGMNVQLKKTPVTYAARRLNAQKRVTVTEEFDLGFAKPAVIGIIRCDAIITSGDKKVIANKLITKGEARIDLLYSCKKDDTDALESMQFTLPYSQILDMDGIDERFESNIDVTAISCDMTAKQGADGDNKLLICELILMINCSAIQNATLDVVTDAYSTTHPCDFAVVNARVERSPRPLCESFMTKASLSYNDGELDCIYDAWAKVNALTARIKSDMNQIAFVGSITYCVMVRNSSATPIMLELEQPFEYAIDVDKLSDGSTLEPSGTIASVSYSLASTNTVEVKAELRLCGNLFDVTTCRALSDISVDDASVKAREGDYALKLYFADKDEDVWNIAKRYSTSISAIMEENDLVTQTLTERGMLLIPIV